MRWQIFVWVSAVLSQTLLAAGGKVAAENVEKSFVNEKLVSTVSILEEYERACEDETFTRDDWQKIDDNFMCYWYQDIGYSLKDINGDGTTEIIIGYLCNSKYRPVIIQSCDDKRVLSWGITDENRMTIYEDGVLEVCPDYPQGLSYIYELEKDFEAVQRLDLRIVQDEFETRYYSYTDRLEKEEFEELRNQYSTVPEKLEWKVLDGFWDSDGTKSSLNKKQKMAISLLEEYERAWDDRGYTDDKWMKIEHGFEDCIDDKIGYSIKDINGDGIEEIILGRQEEAGYSPIIIHYFYEDKMPCLWVGKRNAWEADRMTIYENGVIEQIQPGVYTYYTLYEWKKNFAKPKLYDQLWVMDERGKIKYAHYTGPGDLLTEISKEKFDRMRGIATVPQELEWRPLDDFWNPENPEEYKIVQTENAENTLLKQWVTEAIKQYTESTETEEVYAFHLKDDLLYGSREFQVVEKIPENGCYEYPLTNENEVKFERNNYKFKLEGKNNNLYVEIDIVEDKLYLYPENGGGVIVDYESGNRKAYQQIERGTNNEITYYPDYYVEADYPDMECVDNHFAEVSYDELRNLDYLKIPDSIEGAETVYLDVASALKRYVDENKIEDVFYFNVEEDIISNVTNMIFTCRLKGQKQTLYIDIDSVNMKCHVYPVESEETEQCFFKSEEVFRRIGRAELEEEPVEKILLYQYIDYGIEQYSLAHNTKNSFSVDIEKDWLPYDTELYMKNESEKPYKIDLAKEIIPELSNNIYNFKVSSRTKTLYMSIDTYNMKLYIYDSAEDKQPIQSLQEFYGAYRITQFCPALYYKGVDFDCLPEQEADMLLGRIVIIDEDRFITYDSERRLGEGKGRKTFRGNYMIEKYSIDNPEYSWNAIDYLAISPDIDTAVGISQEDLEKINGVISIRIMEEQESPFISGVKHQYFTMENEDKLIMGSSLNCQYFILEKIDELPNEQQIDELTAEEQTDILEDFYGSYTITEFLPTKFYPALDFRGHIMLPQEEVDLMLGREVIMRETGCRFYDNFRLPNSLHAGRPKDEYMIKRVAINSPDYHLKRKLRSDIYGLKDDMLSEELKQEEYIEISVYPGYEINEERVLPQVYLLDNGKVIMYSMGEYFLLEKKVEEELRTEDIQETENIIIENEKIKDYFFPKESMTLRMNAEFYEDIENRVIKVIEAEVYLVKEYEKGSVYRFAIEPVGELGAEWLNIYFYVTEDKIYRLWSYIFDGDELITFYDDDKLLTEILDTDEKLVNNSEVVCQSENVICELEPEEHGMRYRITNNGNTIVYGRSDVEASGDPGYCENFVWEKGKGLSEFTSKYGIETEILYLTNIREVSSQ